MSLDNDRYTSHKSGVGPSIIKNHPMEAYSG